MRTIEHVSVSEFVFNMEVLDEDFDFDDEPPVADVTTYAELNYPVEDIYG